MRYKVEIVQTVVKRYNIYINAKSQEEADKASKKFNNSTNLADHYKVEEYVDEQEILYVEEIL